MAVIVYDNMVFSNKKQVFWYLNYKPCKTKEDMEYARKLVKSIKFKPEEIWKIII